MILLDTDHLTVPSNSQDSRHGVLLARVQASTDQELALPIVSVEEQCRGWPAQISRLRDIHKQIPAYDRLAKLFDFLNAWEVVPFDVPAADAFKRLRTEGVRIGTQDLKIACIALVQDALLLSANLRDFRRVPDLRVEDWLA
jgi:tRNA(fMet)-specific endonuclease VapC